MPLELSLIPSGSKLESTADGPAIDVSASETRTFLCRLAVTEQIEQESWTSPSGAPPTAKISAKNRSSKFHSSFIAAQRKWYWTFPFARK